MSRYRARRRSSSATTARPVIAFLLIASFGILFAGCTSSTEPEEFSFTPEDLAEARALVESQASEDAPMLEDLADEGGSGITLDVSMASQYDSIRSSALESGEDVYRVVNEFVNLRDAPSISSTVLARLVQGDLLTVEDFPDATWAKVTSLSDGQEGYLASRYIAKLTSEEDLAAEKEKYEGQYFVNFRFLNVRRSADSNSEKLGELEGQKFVRPISIEGEWARIPFEGGEGYVSTQYLAPFLPNFLVRQERFTLPVLHYHFGQDASIDLLEQHLARLKQEDVDLITLREFRMLLLRQEEQDVRLNPRSAVVVVSGVTSENADAISTVLSSAGVSATLFIETKELGISGLTEKTLITLLANGNDAQSAAHTGDDLRSLTNSQVDLEVKQSRKLIEDMTNRPVFAIAYPQGGVNDRVTDFVRDAGYLFGITRGQDRTFTRDQLLRIPAFEVSSFTSADEVARFVLGTGS